MRNRLALASLILALGCSSAVIDRAVAAPRAVPSPSPSLDMGFLLLPAHELEPVASPSASPSPAAASGETVYRVGDEIRLRAADVALPEGSKGPLSFALPPGSPDLNQEGWEIFQQNDPNELRIAVVPIKGGALTLPSLAIQDSAGKPIARTNPWRAQVQSAIAKDDPQPDKPVDLKPPAELAFPWWAVVLLAVFGLIVIGALAYGVYRWSRRNRPLPAAPAEPPKPEDEIALLALAELDKSGVLARGEFKKHYFRVSEILKNYIGARYGFDAPESTTREMLDNLQSAWARELGGNQKQLAALKELFDQLDRVKFTDHVPESVEARQVAETAREFVRATRRRPVVVPQGPVVSTGGANAPR